MPLIHLNRGEDTPHEWITQEEFNRRYPKLAKKMALPVDELCFGAKMRKLRLKRRKTLRLMVQCSGIGVCDISDFEVGRLNFTPELFENYRLAVYS